MCVESPGDEGKCAQPSDSRSGSSRTSSQWTYDELSKLGPVIPASLADEILGIGATLGKRLRRRGEFPIELLSGLGRHHKVRTADLFRYLHLDGSDPKLSVPQGTLHLVDSEHQEGPP